MKKYFLFWVLLALAFRSFAADTTPPSSDNNISFLFMITAKSAVVSKDKNSGTLQISIPKNASTVAFSDRPYRLARPFTHGVESFVKLFKDSDFTTDPPNATFSGTLKGKNSGDKTAIIEFDRPTVVGKNVVFHVLRSLDGYTPAIGKYGFTSIVVDSWWGAVADVFGTSLTCTVGEVFTAGIDTAACIAGIIGSTDSIDNAVNGN
jgi:hypothetical protein